MENIRTLFFDTYALFEIIEGNPNYQKQYTIGITIITTKLNLMELHYGLLAKYGKEEADRYYDRLLEFTVEITDEVIKTASEFRLTFKKRGLSYIDCIGYILAKSRGIKFLTGDRQFEDLEGVEFVK